MTAETNQVSSKSKRKRNLLSRCCIWYFTKWYAAVLVLTIVVLAIVFTGAVVVFVPDFREYCCGMSRDIMRYAIVCYITVIFFAIGVCIATLVNSFQKNWKRIALSLLAFVIGAVVCVFGCILIFHMTHTAFLLKESRRSETSDLYLRDQRWSVNTSSEQGDKKTDDAPATQDETPQLPEVSAEVKPMNAFAFDGLRVFAKLKPDKNLVYSPVGQFGILGLFYLGSTDKTKSELAQVLHWQANDEAMKLLLKKFYTNDKTTHARDVEQAGFHAGTTVRLVQNLAISPEYRKIIEETSFDFREFTPGTNRKTIVREINHWVAERSGYRIKQLLDPRQLSEDTCCVAAATSCFRGGWQHVFEAMKTTKESFTGFHGKTFSILMMKEDARFIYSEDDAVQWVCLPYCGYYAMELILPKDKSDAAFQALETKLSDDYLATLRTAAKMQNVDLWVPSFRIHNTGTMSDVLRQQGLAEIFRPENTSFTGIPNQGVFLSDVYRDESIYVYEGGTTAVSGMADIMYCKLASKDYPVCHLGHPFIYLIREMETGRILFLGRFGANSK